MQAKVPRLIVWGEQLGRVSFSTDPFQLGFSQEASNKNLALKDIKGPTSYKEKI